MLIFHIASRADWVGAQLDGTYTTSTRGRSLADEGYLHCSRYLQVDDVLAAYYSDVIEPLVLLTISTNLLASRLQWDEVPGSALTFPHIYGPLNRDAVVAVAPITRDETGTLTYPWFQPGPLATDRLVIRQARAADWPTYRRTLVDPAQRQFLGGPVPDDEADRRSGEVREKGCLAITLSTGEVIGFALLGFYRTGDFEVSVSLLVEHQAHGYAREAVEATVGWVFAVFTHLERLVAVAQQSNEAGCALLGDLDFIATDYFVEWGERQVLFARRNANQR